MVPERPTLLMVEHGPISQDIAAVLIKCQHNSCSFAQICSRAAVVGFWSFAKSFRQPGLADDDRPTTSDRQLVVHFPLCGTIPSNWKFSRTSITPLRKRWV